MEGTVLETFLGLNPRFLGVFPKDTLPDQIPLGCCLVANLQRSFEPGSHWVSLARQVDGRGLYFDSYGMLPDPVFVRLLGENLLYNRRDYQPLHSKLCGYYSYYFCKKFLEGESFYDILHKHLVPSPIRGNDRIVREFMVGRGIYINHPGSLKFFGYHARNTQAKRRIALLKAVEAYTLDRVIRKISAIVVLNSSRFDLHQIYTDDLNFLKSLKAD
jgi:Family of unknown function (DUF5771)